MTEERKRRKEDNDLRDESKRMLEEQAEIKAKYELASKQVLDQKNQLLLRLSTVKQQHHEQQLKLQNKEQQSKEIKNKEDEKEEKRIRDEEIQQLRVLLQQNSELIAVLETELQKLDALSAQIEQQFALQNDQISAIHKHLDQQHHTQKHSDCLLS